MSIYHSNYYITIIILSILFLQYQALENNVRRGNSVSLDLIQNDLSSNNFINQDSLVHSIIGNIENKNLKKRQVDNKREQTKQKSAAMTKSKTSVQGKRPSKLKPPSSKLKPPASKPKPPTSKPPVSRPTTRKPSNVKRTTRKTTAKVTTARKPLPTRKIKPTTKASSRTITKKPVTSTKKSTPSKTTPKITTSTSTVTTTRNRITKATTTPNPNDFDKLKSKLISDINTLRLKHQAKELTVNSTLTDLAQRLADNPRDVNNVPDRDSVGLMEAFTEIGIYEDPLLIWTSDLENINYKKLDEELVPERFGQLVWISTTDIGCGISRSDEENVVITLCLFYPKGNIPGEYRENVKPEISQKKKKA
uniref:SCP domain-containing protein n=1 Tax=Strongyloides papillosus TaxID=174720 RepID=A0A0N5BL44_STREA